MPTKPGAIHSSSIDLTSMLDVVFILLIFFVVTASFLRETTIGIDSQERNFPQQQTQSEALTISISGDNQIFLDSQPVEITALEARIMQARAAAPDIAVMITADKSSVASTLVEVLDASRLAGVEPRIVY